jgi:hypothetical protein
MTVYRLTAADLVRFRAPCVYILRRGPVVLYVGMSGRGLCRPLDPAHHVLGRVEFDGTEELEVRGCASADEAADLEETLIAELRPRLNGRAIRRFRREKLDLYGGQGAP